ncbi:hypothetical protein HDU93_003305 [Gonapodya sp. JEL0774]|nr:hypothetical protein HDU93_003305 [Gonapodya sp. JEL0774]
MEFPIPGKNGTKEISDEDAIDGSDSGFQSASTPFLESLPLHEPVLPITNSVSLPDMDALGTEGNMTLYSSPQLNNWTDSRRKLLEVEPTSVVIRLSDTQVSGTGVWKRATYLLTVHNDETSSPLNVRRRLRYSDFVAFRERLVKHLQKLARHSLLSLSFDGSTGVLSETSKPSTLGGKVLSTRVGSGMLHTPTTPASPSSILAPTRTMQRSHSNISITSTSSTISLGSPHVASFVPELPPKRVQGRFEPDFLERRRIELEQWINSVKELVEAEGLEGWVGWKEVVGM